MRSFVEKVVLKDSFEIIAPLILSSRSSYVDKLIESILKIKSSFRK